MIHLNHPNAKPDKPNRRLLFFSQCDFEMNFCFPCDEPVVIRRLSWVQL